MLGKKLMVEHTKHTANLPLDSEKAPNLTLVAVISVFSTGITLRQVNVVYISSGRISITIYVTVYVHTYVGLWWYLLSSKLWLCTIWSIHMVPGLQSSVQSYADT